MCVSTQLARDYGKLPDRYYYQLNDRPAENYKEQKQKMFSEGEDEGNESFVVVHSTVKIK